MYLKSKQLIKTTIGSENRLHKVLQIINFANSVNIYGVTESNNERYGHVSKKGLKIKKIKIFLIKILNRILMCKKMC